MSCGACGATNNCLRCGPHAVLHPWQVMDDILIRCCNFGLCRISDINPVGDGDIPPN